MPHEPGRTVFERDQCENGKSISPIDSAQPAMAHDADTDLTSRAGPLSLSLSRTAPPSSSLPLLHTFAGPGQKSPARADSQRPGPAVTGPG